MDKELLTRLYVKDKKSVQNIASALRASPGKVNYWLQKYGIEKRSISEAIYVRHNPHGDPFHQYQFSIDRSSFLFGLGVGLYWGEGTKRNEYAVRLGNTDPYLIRAFLIFLENIYGIEKMRLRFGLQIFSDMDQKKEERFWRDFLHAEASQFYKTINTRSGKLGSYRNKSEHGVLTIYFGNKKLRDLLMSEIEKSRNLRYYAGVR